MDRDIPFNDSDDIYKRIKKPVENIEQKTAVDVSFTDTPDLNGDFNLYKTNKRLLFIRTGLTENKFFTFKEKSFSNTTREIPISSLKGIYMNIFDYSKIYNWLIGLILIIVGFFLIFVIDENSFFNFLFDLIGFIMILSGIIWIIYCLFYKNILSSSAIILAFDSAFTDDREIVTINFYEGSKESSTFYSSLDLTDVDRIRKPEKY